VILIDVNVLVYAHREDAEHHAAYLRWLEEVIGSPASFAVSELVLSSFIRIVTHPRVFLQPTPSDDALAFTDTIREQPHAVLTAPGPRHWSIFRELCRAVGARGNLVPDAYLAALAIESGSEWISTDRDYSRFPGLRWRHPLDRG
jgi:toxin-antitoxin system PIN domain toxin